MRSKSSTNAGHKMFSMATELYPICRSITGDGVRATLHRIARDLPIHINEVPSGTQVFDWTVPEEWNIRNAWIRDINGNTIVDFRNHNLHIMGYSIPVSRKIKLAELILHLHSLPDQPDLIPYRTSYYKNDWGFCLRHTDLVKMVDSEYEVFIDSSLHAGHLTYGELAIPGEVEDEFIISTHICHPSLANDNLAGICVAVQIGKFLLKRPRKYSYRFLFIPGTIGSITWLALNQNLLDHIKSGLVIACAGDTSPLHYKSTPDGDSILDRVMRSVIVTCGQNRQIIDYYPYGYDERQFCSPGINLPVGCLMRSRHGEYPEYHTSADNLEFIKADSMNDTLVTVINAIEVFENNCIYINLKPKCEPRLAKYGLYNDCGGQRNSKFDELVYLWILHLSDGNNDLLSIAEKSGIPFCIVLQAARELRSCGLLEKLQ